MSNIKKYYIFNSLYFIGFMLCSGALMQTFLLQVGFSEKQVYTLNSFIQMMQVIMMVVMTFLSDKIRKVKLVTGLSYLSLTVVCFIFLLGAINPSILGKSYVIAVFIGAGISYLGLGLYMILSYCLPYYIIDMKEYGRVSSLAAAISAKKNGIESILVLERDKELGGILNQCIHNGFGLHTFKEELTGPEYAGRFVDQLLEQQIEYKLNTMVLSITEDKIVTAMNRTEGILEIQAKAVILAMGCRERSIFTRRCAVPAE